MHPALCLLALIWDDDEDLEKAITVMVGGFIP